MSTLAELSAQAAASASTSSAAGTSTFSLPTQATIAEDAIEYVVRLPEGDSINSAAWAALITSYASSLLPSDWMWHKDGLEMRVSHGTRRRLEGVSRVGDSIDDEYLILHLLVCISKRWPELAIAARDGDGEFMLVEAAAELPKWLEPEVAENRLWIAAGQLVVVPLAVGSRASTTLSEDDAVAAVRAGVCDVEASEAVRRAIEARLAPYANGSPSRLHHHTTLAYLTRKVARALAANPQLAQRAAEAFYTRDPRQLRDAARSSVFSPATATSDDDLCSVLVPLTLTRTAYAQLRGQPFRPPKKFPAEWRADDESEAELARRSLGAKIITGFEIMYREDPKRRATKGVAGGKEYDDYLGDLTRVGYFQGNVSGSREHQAREEQARRAWLEATQASSRTSFADAVDAALAAGMSPRPVPDDFCASSEAWLDVSPDELDQLLRPRDEARVEDVDELSEMAKRVERFVAGQGDLDGAQFEDEMSDSDDASSDVAMSPSPRERRLRELVPGLQPGEWGQKQQPANVEPPVTMRPPVLEPETYDGHEVDSDDEPPEQQQPPQGDAPIDEDDFIRFARDALGIDDAAWNKLVAERSARGAYVPAPKPQQAQPPRLDSFDAVMDAMDAELRRAKQQSSSAPASDRLARALDGLDTSKLPDDADDLDGMDDEALEAMDQELKRALGRDHDADLDLDDEEMQAALESLDDDGKREYRMMRDFLTSYQSQAGGAGAVGNLLGRLNQK